jgi:short-subunit dehydrogenase
MSVTLKNIEDQTIVITGATSGIGLCTARMAADRGANVVAVARNEEALKQLCDEINSKQGGRASYAAADVADERALRHAAEVANRDFGGFDTWVNDAGTSIYGRIMDVPLEDFKRMFDTNLWGLVIGSRIAVENLRERGGALINLGSEVSDSAVPLQGLYSASKHAVKAFTEALKMEVEADGLPMSVSLIKPGATFTQFTENARNYLPYEPMLPPPVFAPDLVAEAILYCAENPTKEFIVGEAAKLRISMHTLAPAAGEMINEMTIDSMQNSGEPAKPNRPDGLYSSNSKLKERGDDSRYVVETSPYVSAKMHPLLTAGLAVGGGLAIAALWNTFGRTGHHTDGGRQLSQYSGSRQRGLNQQSVDQSFTDDFNRRSAGGF